MRPATARRVVTSAARRRAGAVALALLAAAAFGPAAPTAATADDGPDPAPSTASSPPVQVDPHAAGLRLKAGATLAAPEVLDIETVESDSAGDERVSDTPAAVTFDLQSEVMFTKDSATLSADADTRLRAIADEIAQQHATWVHVFGFTDDLGTHAHGVVLSKQRAEAVYTELAKDLPDDGSIQFDVRGYAEQYPIADNSSEAGRRQNRRVEITFPKTTGE
ncbi:OmpA family protein [Streptomyces sp. ICBB 8177]|uniref:OmpA family protein n=1 Tax=Streptomyces sp. ICBB 8177 TaxID=563922 RepID=UPI000D674869|nr:OmpA family protein [Streptomyces sp. ICBB 8177]PWI43868.1 hypothetical protein CK485_17515 [Streptomyces sp. ICBB 8177]